MIKFPKPSFQHLGASTTVAPSSEGSRLGYDSRGTVTKKVQAITNNFVSESNSGMRNTQISQMPIEVDIDPLLKDIVFSEDLEQKKLVTRLYRDIYYNDAVGGSAVDLVSTLAFSDLTLGGITDPIAERHFMETIERLNCRTLFPSASVDHLVDGEFIGSMLYNKTSKKLFDLMPHRSDNCKIDALPFFEQDPIITATLDQSVAALFSGDSKRIASLKARLGPEIIDLLSKEAIELDPMSTIHVPRKTFTTGGGVSWFRRILPLYLIEKNLFRGTLVESARRQRGILHITLGDGDAWEPTRSDMEFITELFMNADSDPLGAIIATRLGVSTEEIRQGGDFWKVTDIWDSTATFKMRSLGLSESLLSGEANLATADANMTVFIDWLRTYRDMWTQKFFYNKVFPLVSLSHGYTINTRGKLIRKDGLMTGDVQANLDRMNDGSRLLIPTVHWAKQLKPEGDSAYMDMLNTLTDKGVPVPLRALAAAGGFNLDSLLADSKDNINLMERVMTYAKEIADVKKKYGPQEAADDGSALASTAQDTEFAARQLYNMLNGGRSAVLNQGMGKHVGLASRDFGESSEITTQTRTGKKKMVHNQRAANNRANDSIRRAVSNITANKKTPLTHSTYTPHK